MGPRVLFSAPPEHWPLWRPHLLAAFAAEDLDVDPDRRPGRPLDLRLRRLPPGRAGRATSRRSPGLKAVLSLWAGVEGIVGNATLTGAALPHGRRRAHRAAWRNGSRATCCATTSGSTRTSSARTASGATTSCRRSPPTARVGLLGLGELGRAVAATLAGLGFDLARLEPPAEGAPRHRHATPARTASPRCCGAPRSSSRCCRRPPATENLLDARAPRAAAAGRPADQPRPRQPDRRRRAARRARPRAPRARDARRLPRGAAAARPPVLGASADHRHPARRLRDPPRDRRRGDRPQRPPRRGRQAVPPRRRPQRRLLTAPEPWWPARVRSRTGPWRVGWQLEREPDRREPRPFAAFRAEEGDVELHLRCAEPHRLGHGGRHPGLCRLGNLRQRQQQARSRVVVSGLDEARLTDHARHRRELGPEGGEKRGRHGPGRRRRPPAARPPPTARRPPCRRASRPRPAAAASPKARRG